MKKKRSKHSIKQDRAKRSKEGWERGRKAKKIGNPRYKVEIITDKNGVRRKVHKLRKNK